MNIISDLEKIYRAGIAAVNPSACIHSCIQLDDNTLFIRRGNDVLYELDLDSVERIFVIGAGKGTAPMAEAIEDILGHRITDGIISVKEGYTGSLSRIVQREASHPVPDKRGMDAAREIVDLLGDTGEDDLVISLISGGGSALLPLPAEGISLDDKKEVTGLLLRCGAPIHEINAVRKHLSSIKGGLLARAAFPARVLNLILSDVVGDDLDVIASGPFVPDRSTFRTVYDILLRNALLEKIPASVLSRIEGGVKGDLPENPGPDDSVFTRVINHVAGSNIQALEAAESIARDLGYSTLILSSMIEGDAAEAALWHSRILREIHVSSHPVKRPACLLSGGETTVLVRGNGIGGRNMEFAMRAIPYIEGIPGALMASIGTDGSDGPTDAAGAFVTGDTMAGIRSEGIDLERFMNENDSYSLFQRIGGLIKTGPTNTNVMDLRIMIIF